MGMLPSIEEQMRQKRGLNQSSSPHTEDWLLKLCPPMALPAKECFDESALKRAWNWLRRRV